MAKHNLHKKRSPFLWLLVGLICLCGLCMALLSFTQRAPAPAQTPGGAPAQTPAQTSAQTPAPALAPAPTAAEARPQGGATAAPAAPAPGGLEQNRHQASLAVTETALQGQISIAYVNKGQDTLYAINLHLHPNAVQPGSMAIQAVTLNGVRAYHTFEREGAILNVPLINELEPGEEARLYVEFTVALPQEGGFGQLPEENTGLALYHVFPMPAIYEDTWRLYAQPGEVEYTPLADWQVLLETERLPMVLHCEIRSLEDGRYLCTGQTAGWEMWLE